MNNEELAKLGSILDAFQNEPDIQKATALAIDYNDYYMAYSDSSDADFESGLKLGYADYMRVMKGYQSIIDWTR